MSNFILYCVLLQIILIQEVKMHIDVYSNALICVYSSLICLHRGNEEIKLWRDSTV